MNHDQSTDEELYGALRSALRNEPPMATSPYDDLVRGRSRLRRRRIGTAASVAAVVPAVALVATMVPSGPAAGPDGPGFAESPSDTESAAVECVEAVEGQLSPLMRSSDGLRSPRVVTGSDRGKVKAVKPDGFRASRPVVAGRGTLAALERAKLESLPSGDGAVQPAEAAAMPCKEGDGQPIHFPELDRLEEALTYQLDPSNEHLTTFLAGGGVMAKAEPGAEPEERLAMGSVTGDWSEGNRVGSVSLGVEDTGAGDFGLRDPDAASCEDPFLWLGPRLTCEQRELTDGTVVLIGTGSQSGFERITVRYERADGQVVWATADQASSIWWEDGSGASPLDSPPVTVDQLIELTQDSRVHL